MLPKRLAPMLICVTCSFHKCFLLYALCRDHLREVGCLAGHQQPNNEPEQAEHRTEDLDHEDLDESLCCQQNSHGDVIRNGAYNVGSAASANAALLPLMPTLTPHIRLHRPTVKPDQNSAKPVYMFAPLYTLSGLTSFNFAEKTIDIMTP